MRATIKTSVDDRIPSDLLKSFQAVSPRRLHLVPGDVAKQVPQVLSQVYLRFGV